MLANNLANASSSGFKLDREFYSLYTATDTTEQALPLVERPWIDLSQGVIQTTGKPLDVALQGKGFFVVTGPSGPLYTRSGNFHISNAGAVLSQEGYPVLLRGGTPLQTPSTVNLIIDANGFVSADGQALGQLNIVDFSKSDALEKVGATCFRSAQPAASPSPSTAEVRQGSLENSNVNAAQSAVRLVSIMRQSEMLQKAILLGSEMNRKVFEEVAKV